MLSLATVFSDEGVMSRTISSIYKSLLRAVNDLVVELQQETGDMGIRYWAWEGRMDEDKMPTETLVGLDGYNFDENKGLWIIRAAITISSYNDANLHQESEMLDLIHEKFGYHKKVDLRLPDSGEVFSQLFVTEFQVMPMGQSEMRNYRTCAFELLRTDTGEAE